MSEKLEDRGGARERKLKKKMTPTSLVEEEAVKVEVLRP